MPDAAGAAFDVVDSFNPSSTLVPVTRVEGITGAADGSASRACRVVDAGTTCASAASALAG